LWSGDSFQSELFSCSFISSISLCIASICSFPDWVSLAFQRPFFFLAIGSRTFLSPFAAAVSFAELFLVLCLWSRHHHHRFHVFVVQ
jgi:hypothetical protein